MKYLSDLLRHIDFENTNFKGNPRMSFGPKSNFLKIAFMNLRESSEHACQNERKRRNRPILLDRRCNRIRPFFLALASAKSSSSRTTYLTSKSLGTSSPRWNLRSGASRLESSTSSSQSSYSTQTGYSIRYLIIPYHTLLDRIQ